MGLSLSLHLPPGSMHHLPPPLPPGRHLVLLCPLHARRSRAVFVELTRYSPAVGLHAAVTLRLEFPAAGHAVTAVSVRPFPLQRLSTGLSLPLLTSVGARPALPRPAQAPPTPAAPGPAHRSPRPPAGEPAALRAVLLRGRGAHLAQGRV